MTDEQTAAAIVADSRNACDETAMEAAIVRALQAARESAFTAHAADPAGRNYCHTAGDVSNSLCREMETSNIMGGPLWWGEMYRRIGLELCRAFNAGRADALVDQKPPPGHIIDDAGVVRKVLGTFVLTEEGCVVGNGAKVFLMSDNWRDGKYIYQVTASVDLGEPDDRKCFEDPAKAAEYMKQRIKAAEAAKEGKA